MKRKMIAIFTVMMLIISMGTANLFAFDTSSEEYLGFLYNNSSDNGKKACGKLTPSGGVARLEIRENNGTTVCASSVYPTYPQNTHMTKTQCPSYETRKFYALSEDGNQTWGTQTIYLSSY